VAPGPSPYLTNEVCAWLEQLQASGPKTAGPGRWRDLRAPGLLEGEELRIRALRGI